MAGKRGANHFWNNGELKKTCDIILVALHVVAPDLPFYAIAIKGAHFTMVIFLAAALKQC